VVEGTDGPLFADFHALRHSYIALLDRAGATLKEAMQLARHSDPKLTMARYGRAPLEDLAGKIGELPSLLTGPSRGASLPLAATGTEGNQRATGFELPTREVAGLPVACARTEIPCDPLTTVERIGPEAAAAEDRRETLEMKPFASDCARVRTTEKNSPSRIRTYNKPVNSRLLYR